MILAYECDTIAPNTEQLNGIKYFVENSQLINNKGEINVEFSKLLQRANLNVLEAYIVRELESWEDPPYKPYSERLAEAGRDADTFLKARFPELKDYNEITSFYDRQVSVNQDVYFEIGLIVGGKMAFEISRRMEELK